MRTATFYITEIDGKFKPFTTAEIASWVAGQCADRGMTIGLVAHRVTVELPDEEA